jgi:hypothetical protein
MISPHRALTRLLEISLPDPIAADVMADLADVAADAGTSHAPLDEILFTMWHLAPIALANIATPLRLLQLAGALTGAMTSVTLLSTLWTSILALVPLRADHAPGFILIVAAIPFATIATAIGFSFARALGRTLLRVQR